jgi:Zn-dependent protease
LKAFRYHGAPMDSIAFKVVDFGIQLAVILFSISLHESAHAWSALKFGDTTARDLGRISLNPIRHIDPFGSVLLPLMMYFFSGGRIIFGAAKPTPVDLRNTPNPRLANLVVSAAGPVSNFLLAIAGVGLLTIIRSAAPEAIGDLALALQGQSFAAGALAPIVYVLFQFALVNVGLGVFNLIPIPPLDGSGVVASVVGEPALRLFRVIAPFGFLILILLLSTRLLRVLILPFYLLVYRAVGLPV